VAGLAADEVFHELLDLGELGLELFELSAFGLGELVDNHLEADLGLLLGLLGLGLLVLLHGLRGLLLAAGTCCWFPVCAAWRMAWAEF